MKLEVLAPRFWDFASRATIPSKDEGLMRFRPYASQRYFIGEVFKALADDRRQIVGLKPRQIGETTALSIFDLFWLLAHRGLTGQFVADSDGNKDFFRQLIGEVYDSLQPFPRYHFGPMERNNRNGVAWRNGSQMLFQTASNAKVGRGRGLVYMHGTEAPLWENEDAVSSLRAAFSERHPARCFIFEGTANGFNWFYDLWHEAEKSVSMAAIFVAWWHHELYQVEPNSKIFRVYWDGRLTSDERAWQREITRKWNTTVQPEQWAWYRWKQAEVIGDEHMMMQEFPTLPQVAFISSGNPFLGHVPMDRLRDGLASGPKAKCYRYEFGGTIEETKLVPTDPVNAELKIWEEPDQKGYYITACDPAFGTGKDRSVVTVWRARRQSLTQVAEFSSDTIPTRELAWVLLHLAGSYCPKSWLILEVNGPGLTVLSEIQRLQNFGWGTGGSPSTMLNVLGGIRSYFFRRADSALAGTGARDWLSTPRYRAQIFYRMRDCLLNPGQIIVRSQDLVQELGTLRQEGDQFMASGRAHDDRVSTLAMAIEQWSSQVMSMLLYAPPEGPEETKPEDPGTVEQRMMDRFFNRINNPPKAVGRR
jgi:hypothetical protein